MEIMEIFLLNSSILICLIALLIQQKAQANDVSRGSNKVDNPQRTTEATTTPSPEWLEYQRERFSNTKDVESLRKMLDPASRLLKNQKDQLINLTPTRVEEQSNRNNTHAQVEIEKPDKDGETKSDKGNEDDDDENNDNDDEKRSKEGSTSLLTFAIKDIKYPTMRGFIGFLRRLKRSWLRRSAMTIEQKINDLKRLKTKLMYLIEDHFNMLWAPKEYARRRRRGVLEESNFKFPPEAALITINFLTFAVFLIKLVLQVVHIIKSKHYKLSGLGLGFGDRDTMTKVS